MLREDSKKRCGLKFRFEMRDKYDKENGKAPMRESVKMKLLKFVISKFEGTVLDCFPFWNQLGREIDKQDITSFYSYDI